MRRVAGLKSDAFAHFAVVAGEANIDSLFWAHGLSGRVFGRLLQLLQLYAKSLRSLRYIGARPKGKAFSVRVSPLAFLVCHSDSWSLAGCLLDINVPALSCALLCIICR